MYSRKKANGNFDASNSITYFSQNQNAICEYQYDIASPQEIRLYRKLSEIIYDVETTLTSSHDNRINNNHLSLQEVVTIIQDASSTSRKYIAQYIEFLYNQLISISLFLLFIN